MKRCAGCDTPKETWRFWRNRYRKDGLQVYCKTCHRKRMEHVKR